MHRQQKIYMVDNDDTKLTYLQGLLDSYYQVQGFESGSDVLVAVGLASPDLLILEVTLAGMSGYEIMALLKISKRYSSIPIILVSGKVGADEVSGAIELGAAAYLCKPYNADEMLATVQALLAPSLAH